CSSRQLSSPRERRVPSSRKPGKNTRTQRMTMQEIQKTFMVGHLIVKANAIDAGAQSKRKALELGEPGEDSKTASCAGHAGGFSFFTGKFKSTKAANNRCSQWRGASAAGC